jgi:hypothetical protein
MSGFSALVLFFRLQNCVRGDFLNFHKHPGFWPLPIATLNFSVVVTYVTVRSYSTPRFNFRTYIQPLPLEQNTSRFRPFVLNYVHNSGGWVVCCLGLVSFCCVRTMGWKKCNFKDVLTKGYSCFRNGRDEWETECFLFKPRKPGRHWSLSPRGLGEAQESSKEVKIFRQNNKFFFFFYCIGKRVGCCCISGRRCVCISNRETSQ